MKDYISKLNIVAAEYLAKAGMPRVACVTCRVPQMNAYSSGIIYSRPISIRVIPSGGGSCSPGPNGSVHTYNNPYIGASGTFVSYVSVPDSNNGLNNCLYTTCATFVGPAGNLNRSKSYATAPVPSLPVSGVCEPYFLNVYSLIRDVVTQPRR